MKAHLLILVLSIFSSKIFAETVELRPGQGVAEVVSLGQSSLVYIHGEAAQILFNSLLVEPYTPPHSTSVIKRLKNVECTQNTEEIFCMISVKNKE